MTVIPIVSAKFTTVFKPGDLPRIDPDKPVFQLNLEGLVIEVRVNAKAARKLAAWTGGTVLQGNLRYSDGRLSLAEAGFQFLDPKPAPPPRARTSPRWEVHHEHDRETAHG